MLHVLVDQIATDEAQDVRDGLITLTQAYERLEVFISNGEALELAKDIVEYHTDDDFWGRLEAGLGRGVVPELEWE